MVSRRWGCSWFMVLGFFMGCGDDSPDPGPDLGLRCSSDSECDDGEYCNGAETCDPDAPGANANGCLPGPGAPCADCDEVADSCAGCDVDPDADGDGVDAVGCGGTDCDDMDADRYPGNAEVCDSDGHDEDCDPATVAGTDGDADADGFVSASCCNGDVCGDDCDDTRISVNPEAGEICNLMDDDCNGTIDEGVLVTFYRDVDGDLFGVDDMTTLACSAPPGYTFAGGDCDDANPGRNPGNLENCDTAIDDNCSGGANEDCACIGSETRPCAGAMGVCATGSQTCSGGTFGGCSISPSTEVCGDSLDQNCNGTTDDEIEVGVDAQLGPAGTCSGLDYSPSMLGTREVCELVGVGMTPSVLLSWYDVRVSAGAYYDQPVELGYGELSFSPWLSINSSNDPSFTPRGGFAIVIVEADGGALTGTHGDLSAWDSGAPRTRNGLAIEWLYQQPIGTTDDYILIRRLTGDVSGSEVLAYCPVPASLRVETSAPARQPGITVTYRPANSHARVTEQVTVSLAGERFSCSTSDPMLPGWSQGQELNVGVTASNADVPASAVGAAVRWSPVSGTAALAAVELAGTCP